MKHIFIKLFAILSCVLPLASIGNAQPTQISEFQIPFEFVVKDKVFPAGKYSIGRVNQGNPNLLLLKNTNGEQKMVLLAQNSNDSQPKQPRLTFKRFEERYFLEGITVNGNKNGQRVLLNISATKVPKTQKAFLIDSNKCLPAVQAESIRQN